MISFRVLSLLFQKAVLTFNQTMLCFLHLLSTAQRHSPERQDENLHQHTLSRALTSLERSNSDSRRMTPWSRKERPVRHKDSHKVPSVNNATDSTLGCTLLSRLQHTGFTYIVRASPSPLRLDLAAVFFNRNKLQQENIHFGMSVCSIFLLLALTSVVLMGIDLLKTVYNGLFR